MLATKLWEHRAGRFSCIPPLFHAFWDGLPNAISDQIMASEFFIVMSLVTQLFC
jgi:hypothetical protein